MNARVIVEGMGEILTVLMFLAPAIPMTRADQISSQVGIHMDGRT